MQSPDEDDTAPLNLNVPSVFSTEDENENQLLSQSNGKILPEDRTRSVSPSDFPRRQNSVPGGRSLGPSPTICQASPFIYCGNQNNNRRLVQHNSMRATYSNADRERRKDQSHSNGSRNGSRRLKRHDTDPSMEKRHSGLRA